MFLSKALLLLASVVPLSSYVNHKRVLLLFTPSAQDVRYTQQLVLLKQNEAAMNERDLVIVSNIGADPAQRALFHIKPEEFTVILIGKDGGEKLRRHTPIPYKKLATIIDAMPMRQDEMRRKQ